MSWRLYIIQMLDIILRVPPLFVLDSMLNGSLPAFWIADNVRRQTIPNEFIHNISWILFRTLGMRLLGSKLFGVLFNITYNTTTMNSKILSLRFFVGYYYYYYYQ